VLFYFTFIFMCSYIHHALFENMHRMKQKEILLLIYFSPFKYFKRKLSFQD